MKTDIDMNPMADLAFLLVTFFLLTTQLKGNEAINIVKPRADVKKKLPDKGLMRILISEDGNVYFGLTEKQKRIKVLESMAKQFNTSFSTGEKDAFALTSSFGMPFNELNSFLEEPSSKRNAMDQPGIPFDSIHNELQMWVSHAKRLYPNLNISIEGDRKTPYAEIDQVFDMFTNRGITDFFLVTRMEKIEN
jgi:biopolymer transport protein ExbD